MTAKNTRELPLEYIEALMDLLKSRFDTYPDRHKTIEWNKVKARLETNPEKLWSLHEMEKSGGEPDVVGLDNDSGEYIFYDCSPESPKGRRSICYDHEALNARKEFKPKNSALGMANDMGIELLTKAEYQVLQGLGDFDTKTSSWLKTPPDIRNRGGAIFGDFRYGTTFIYHNGAESYYAVRGFRGSLRI